CAVLRALGAPAERVRVLVAAVETLLQRVPSPEALEPGWLRIRRGEVLTRETLEAFAQIAGYLTDERIDEPGEIAVLGEVVDIFPAAATAPLRLRLGEGDEVQSLEVYDPLTQRTEGEELDEGWIGPASELVLPPTKAGRAVERVPGIEHRLAGHYRKLESVLALMAKAKIAQDPSAPQRIDGFLEQLNDARE